ncbi:MAG TPA: hypothetical protein VH575_08945 [Gemmataceae bacterium]|jgi:hypothetical protein
MLKAIRSQQRGAFARDERLGGIDEEVLRFFTDRALFSGVFFLTFLRATA